MTKVETGYACIKEALWLPQSPLRAKSSVAARNASNCARLNGFGALQVWALPARKAKRAAHAKPARQQQHGACAAAKQHKGTSMASAGQRKRVAKTTQCYRQTIPVKRQACLACTFTFLSAIGR